jgi:hypothetical protein
MKHLCLVLTLAGCLTLLPSAAWAQSAPANDPQPSTGTGLVVVGWIATGLGVLNLATLPICFADFYPEDAETLCVIGSATIGGVGLALGVPFLIVGYSQKADYREWKARNGMAYHLQNTYVTVASDGVGLSYSAAF